MPKGACDAGSAQAGNRIENLFTLPTARWSIFPKNETVARDKRDKEVLRIPGLEQFLIEEFLMTRVATLAGYPPVRHSRRAQSPDIIRLGGGCPDAGLRAERAAWVAATRLPIYAGYPEVAPAGPGPQGSARAWRRRSVAFE